MTATAAPAVIDALVVLGQETFSDTLDTIDGFTYSVENAHKLIIGVSDPDDPFGAPAWVSRHEPMEGYGPDRHEFLTVTCRFVLLPFDTLSEARAALVADLNMFDTALRADRTLGGVVIEAHLDELAMTQAGGPSGDEVRLGFLVSADLYL